MNRENINLRSDFATIVPIANKSLCEDCVPNVNATKSSGSSPGDATLTSSNQTFTDHTNPIQIAPAIPWNQVEAGAC